MRGMVTIQSLAVGGRAPSSLRRPAIWTVRLPSSTMRGPGQAFVQQLGLAEDLARPADQRGEQALAAVADGDGDVVPKQRSGSRVEHERTEGEARSLHAAIYSPFASFWNS